MGSYTVLVLEEATIKRLLKNKSVALEVFETLESTQKHLRKYRGAQQIHVCLAEHQSQGQGRFQRNWHSPQGENLYFSMLYPFKKDLNQLAGLSLIVALCISKTLNALYDLPESVLTKWPNDILCDGKKLAGILIEAHAETHDCCQAIIGIGINVNMLDAKEITQDWTSIKKLTDQSHDRNALAAKLVDNLLAYLEKFVAHGLGSFMQEWSAHDYLRNQTITIKSGAREVTGVAQGVNEQGQLLIRLEKDSTLESFSAGETTVLKSQ